MSADQDRQDRTTAGQDRGERAFPDVPLLLWPLGFIAALAFAAEPRFFFIAAAVFIGILGGWEWWCAFRRWFHDRTPMNFR